MPKKAVSKTEALRVYTHRDGHDRVWWSIEPPRTLLPDEPKTHFVYNLSDFFYQIIRLSTRIAAKRQPSPDIPNSKLSDSALTLQKRPVRK